MTDKRPHDYASEILALPESERAAAIEAMPFNLRGWVKELMGKRKEEATTIPETYHKPTVEACLKYLHTTDGPCAQARALVKALDHKRKVVRAKVFMSSDGTAAAREAQALASDEYQQVISDLYDATVEMETMNTKRKTAELHIEVWRSTNANQRKGNI